LKRKGRRWEGRKETGLNAISKSSQSEIIIKNPTNLTAA